MLVTEQDIKSRRLAVFPVGWERWGTVEQALARLMREWEEDMVHHLRDHTVPAGWGLLVGADTHRGTVTERVAKCVDGRGLVFVEPAQYQTRQGQEFDVVEVATGRVVERSRWLRAGKP